MPTGFRPLASPTAREAPGLPMRSANCPYERVRPYGISRSAAHTARWNGVPCRFKGRSNAVRRPAKYSASCSRAASNGSSSRSPKLSCGGRWRWPSM